MINLKCRTEFSFREAYGPIAKVLAATQGPVGICDRFVTWGHVQFEKACRKAGRKPLLGVELAVVDDMTLSEKQGVNFMSFLACNNAGLREIYELVTLSTKHSYYHPRIDYGVLFDISDNVIILSGSSPVWGSLPNKKNLFIELSPTSNRRALEIARERGIRVVATSDNLYPLPSDLSSYQIVSGRNEQKRTGAAHLLNEHEWRIIWPNAEDAIANQQLIADMCSVSLPSASMPHISAEKSLEVMCREAAPSRRIDLSNPVYEARLRREIDMIKEKEFEDYFYIVNDMVHYAKQHMLVGPARGSSCGSLVCYLLGITEIDPIPYSLLFERFIDINRKDLPDIDIDFPDDRRDLVFEYLRQKYGADCVARLGTVARYKAKSCIGDVAKALGIPQWEVADLKGAIIERSTGDSRAAFCILDTFNELEVGRQTLAKHPSLAVASELEGHATHSGQHAAGVVVTSEPVSNYCSVDVKNGSAQVDKKDAEQLGLLKMDCLGLRTLSVIQDVLDQVGWTREQLISFPTDDKKAFAVLNEGKFSGIFQFEGFALQSLCKQLHVDSFEDIASLTALARPGPLNSGGATEFLRRRNGEKETTHLHPLIAHTTQVTYGVVIYQEQVMQIARDMGKLSWEDVSDLRKAMSKSLGKEFFDGYWDRFKIGAVEQGVELGDAQHVWDNINTMGSWSFNRSHAVAYALVSYWCLLLKARFPLEFAAACLRNARDDDQCIKLLRELHREGFKYKAYDAKLSEKNWSVQDGQLIGGLLNIKGIGEKLAEDILMRRATGKPLTDRQKNLLANGTTPYDMVFECEERWGHIKRDPAAHNIKSKLWDLDQLTDECDGTFVFIAKLKEKNLRDHNELSNLQKRGGREMKGQTKFLNMTLEDDTGPIIAQVDRRSYLKWGLPIVEEGRLGDWYIWKGQIRRGFRKVYIERWRKLT